MGRPVHADQAYRAFLSIYSPEGTLANRVDACRDGFTQAP